MPDESSLSAFDPTAAAMSDSSRPAALSAAAFGRNSAGTPVKSPTKSPARPVLRHSVDDVSYRQTDSTRAIDQAQPADAGASSAAADLDSVAQSADKHSKYMNLLSAVYSQPPGPKPRSPAAAATSSKSHQQLPLTADGAAAPPPLRSSASPKGVAAGGAGCKTSSGSSSTTPSLRRSIRASILDSSQGASMIPPSPEAAAAAASFGSGGAARPQHGMGAGSSKALAAGQVVTSPVSRLRSSAGSTAGASREVVSPVRRSAPSAQQPRPAYAFGTRIEPSPAAAARRRPSPTRPGPAAAGASSSGGGGGSPGSLAGADAGGERLGRLRAAASPQRLPSAARASAPAGSVSGHGLRSASAPRMTSAEKMQSRFTQHAAAAAAQRSRTPNPAQRAAAAAAASVGSGVNAARGLRVSTHAAASASKHIARMRASDTAAGGVGAVQQHSRLPGFSSTKMGLRSPNAPGAAHLSSPMLRAGSRSVLAASPSAMGPAAAGPQRPGSAGGRSIPAASSVSRGPGKPGVRSLGLSLPGAGSIAGDAAAAAAAASSSGCGPLMVPVIKDRYKDLFRHTPAALAVEEARAGAAGGGAGAGGTQLPSPVAEHGRGRGGVGVPKLALGGLARQGSGELLAAPRGPSQQQQQQQHEAVDDSGSPFLGRMSGMAGGAAVPAQQQGSSFSTPQGQQRKHVVPLLALSTITPVGKTRPAAAAAAAAAAAGEASPFTPPQEAGGYARAAAAGYEPLPVQGIDLTPCRSSAGPGVHDEEEETPSLLTKSQPRTGSSSSKIGGWEGREEESALAAAAATASPQLAPRDLSSSSGGFDAPAQQQQQRQVHHGSGEGAQGAPVAAAAAAAARGFVVPSLQLQGGGAAATATAGGCSFDSPPKHRRGERESPSSSAEAGSHGTLKTKAHTLCSTASSGHAAARTTAAAAAGRSGPPSASKAAGAAAKPRLRVGGGGGAAAAAAAAGGSVLQDTAAAAAEQPLGRGKVSGPPVRRSIASGIPSPTPAGTTPSRAAGGAGHSRTLRVDATPGSGGQYGGRTTPLPSPSFKKLGTPVPRLDLTPVLASLAAEQEGSPGGTDQQQQGSHNGMLLLEDAPRPRRLELDDDEADEGQPDGHHLQAGHSGRRQSSGRGRPGSAGRANAGGGGGGGSGRGKSGSGRGQGAGSSAKKGGGAPGSSKGSAEPPPQESFYVYESVMPPEEQRTYEELRRVLLKAPGGSKHATNLQGIWCCYQDARRNTEAMAFRGHRLLDQVSTEYNSFRQEAQVKMDQLQEEAEQARQELQLTMVAQSVPASALQLAAKERENQELAAEVSLLRQQLVEMERALQMASDYHAATQAAHQEQQVPVHARVIAGSATTSILTSQVVQQQVELAQVEKRMEDMKAALHLACGVLRQTNYMDQASALRSQLDFDTLTVLDTIMATEEMEAVAMQQQQQAQAAHMAMLQEGGYQGEAGMPGSMPAAAAAVQIEEVVEAGKL